MEALITFLVVLIISAIGTWLKKLAQNQADDASNQTKGSPPASRPGPSSPQRKMVGWEEELRRLLGEEAPAPPLAKPPPPVISRPKPPPVPVSPNPAKPPTVVVRAPTPDVTPLPVPSVERVSTGELARLNESRSAYERASNLDKTVAEYLKKIPGQHVQPTAVLARAKTSPEVTQTLSLFRNPSAARQAILASIILGPPKALESISSNAPLA